MANSTDISDNRDGENFRSTMRRTSFAQESMISVLKGKDKLLTLTLSILNCKIAPHPKQLCNPIALDHSQVIKYPTPTIGRFTSDLRKLLIRAQLAGIVVAQEEILYHLKCAIPSVCLVE